MRYEYGHLEILAQDGTQWCNEAARVKPWKLSRKIARKMPTVPVGHQILVHLQRKRFHIPRNPLQKLPDS